MVLVAAERAFYEASAQVIPVLLLVLAVEMARYQTPPQEPLRAVYAFLFVVFGMVVAELAALIALAADADSFPLRMFTALGIGIGLSIVFVRAGLLVHENLRKTVSKEVADRFEFRITVASIAVLSLATLALIIAASS